VVPLEKKELTMLRFPGIQRSRRQRGLLAASSLLLLLSSHSLAQSGRKTVKPTQNPTNIPQPNDDVSAPPNARDLKHKVTLLVGRQPTSKHLISEDAIFEQFLKRLNEIKNVTATSIGDLKRDAMIKRTKSETETIAVLVRFDIDTFQKGTIFLNSPDMDVDVSVFAPVTGQEKFKGKVYYKAVGGPMLKKDNWPNGTPIRITTEAVGIEAAEQVRDWLVLEDLKKKD
jgi:hypothetical protein